MQSLQHPVAIEQRPHFVERQEFDGNILGRFEMPGSNRLDIPRQITISKVGVRPRIGRENHELLPLPVAITRLFEQLPPSRVERRGIIGFTHPRTQLIRHQSRGMTVLTLKDKLPLGRNGYHVYPVGILKNIIIGNLAPVGQLHMFVPHGEPRLFSNITAAQHTPRLYRFFFHRHNFQDK